MSDTKKKLTRLQYFEWCLSIEKLSHAKTRVKLVGQEHQAQMWKCKAENLQLQLLRSRIEDAQAGVTAAENAYEDEKKGLEKKLGMSLNGKIINENLEILSDSDLK